MSTINYTVTVSGGLFLVDGASKPKLTFRDGDTYVFDQADSSNASNTFRLSATSDNSGASEYTTGVTVTGTAGSAGAKTTIVTSSSTTDTLYYYSGDTAGYGEEFSNSGYNTTSEGILKPIVGGAGEKWGPMLNHSIDQLIDKTVPASGGTFTGAVTLPSPVITGTPTGITAAHLEAGVLPSDVTGGSGLTALGTVTAGTIASGVTVSELNFGTNKGKFTSLEADYWRLHTGLATTGEFITANWERCDDSGFDYVGGGMSESSGTFTFPSVGLYRVAFQTYCTRDGDTDFVDVEIYTTPDNSAYTAIAQQRTSIDKVSFANVREAVTVECLFNVVTTANYKVKFWVEALSSTTFNASSTRSYTSVTFMKLGEVN